MGAILTAAFTLVVNNLDVILGTIAAGSVLGFLLGKFFTEKRYDKWGKGIDSLGYGIGVFITAGFSRWPYTKKAWNKTLEPFFIALIRLFALNLLAGIIRGMLSDNPKQAEKAL